MFQQASAFNQNIGGWNTTAVTDMSAMFSEASTFNQNIGGWNTAAATTMSGMFFRANSFNNGGSNSINNWNTAAVTDMSGMFSEANVFNQNIGLWNTANVIDMSGMFSGAIVFNQNIGLWNTAAVTDMNNMFNGANAFNQNIGTWTLNPAVDLSFMFDNSGMDCNNYSATLIGWNANSSTPNGRNLGAAGLQYGTNAVAARTNLTGAKGWTITGDTPSGFSCVPINSNDFVTVWNLSEVAAPNNQITFGVATSGTVNYTWETIPAAASGSGTFTGSTATITGLPAFAVIRLSIQPANFQRINIDQGIDRGGLTLVENWGTTAWTSMQTAFRGCNNLQVTATDVPDLSGVTDMSKMFERCTNLNSPGNINTWNTTAVINMQNMFDFASAFNQNIGAWNTAAVTNMSGMFVGASSFNQNIGSWNTGAVTLMANMFNGASSFNQNISSWNTAAVYHMASMFSGASAFNQNIGSWNTAAVIYMNDMFSGASAFNQNIALWTLNPIVDLNNMLDNSGMNCNNYSATLIGWNANPSTPTGRNLGATGRQYGTNAVAARTNLTGAKAWTITGDVPSGSLCDIILPVTWLYVNGQLQNGNAIIKWGTASESNTDKFEIEHSTDGINFFKAGTKDAAGNSSSTKQYEFVHLSPVIGKNYYRIKQIDLDDRFSYSSTIVIDVKNETTRISVYPNPAQHFIIISFNSTALKTSLKLFNQQGQLVQQLALQGTLQQQKVDVSKLSAGVYTAQLLTDKGLEIFKFIKL